MQSIAQWIAPCKCGCLTNRHTLWIFCALDWLLKTTHMYYTGIYNAMKTIVREAYETLKSYWKSRQQDGASPNIMSSMVCGSLSVWTFEFYCNISDRFSEA